MEFYSASSLFVFVVYLLAYLGNTYIGLILGYPLEKEGASLLLTIDGISEAQGCIQICLVSDEALFLKECTWHESILVSGKERLQHRFENLPPGQYAISLFHDLNQNQILDKRSILPIPKEPFGFSNNPPVTFGPPRFTDCLFELNQTNLKLTIRLRKL